MPSLRPKRRWLCFSLRTAVVALTLFCAWSGYLCNRAHQQRLAVRELREVFATVGYDRNPDTLLAPRWLRSLVGDDFFLRVMSVHFSSPMVGRTSRPMRADELEQAVASMQRLPALNQIWFNHTGIRDADLALLAPLGKRVECLYFNEFLNPNLTGIGIKELSGWPRLKHLTLYSDAVKSPEMLPFADCVHLETLAIGRCVLEPSAFAALGRCPNLNALTLHGCTFSGESLVLLRSAPRLKFVTLHNMEVNDPHAPYQWVVDSSSRIKTVSHRDLPTTYEFRPNDGESFSLFMWKITSPNPYNAWLKKTLPGVTASTFSTR